MSIDLERFPWSDSANRMLTYVTKGWYDKSYGACVPWTEFNQKMLFRKNSDNTECVNKNKSINIPKGSQENS